MRRLEDRPRFWLIVALAVVVALIPVLWLYATNSRLAASWHGFLHTAIANQFPSSAIPPENPFFAGEPLPYYWFYHFLNYLLRTLLGINPLYAFHLMTLLSLVAVIVFGALIGKRQFGSTTAGLLIGYFTLAGVNPAGPLIALAKHFIAGGPLFSPVTGNIETVFVTNQMADGWMTHPLLGALYLFSDWRVGQNLVWFLDISARGPALACFMALLYFFLRSHGERQWLPAVVLMAALTIALNPVIGLAAVGCLGLASLLVLAIQSRSQVRHVSTNGWFARALPVLACAAGSAVAFPTFRHLFLYGDGTTSLVSAGTMINKLVLVLSTHGLLLAFAFLGDRKASEETRSLIRPVGAAGVLLLVAFVLLRLEEGNEHNLANVATCLLGTPAAAWGYQAARGGGPSRARIWFAWLVFLPVTIATLSAYTTRPDLPLTFTDGTPQRLPATSPLNHLYEWIREHAPRSAVFVVDPREPVKMSGNVSELPAFAARALFTDQASYLTPFDDAPLRTDISSRLASGEPLDSATRSYFRRFERPLYLITYHADQSVVRERLEHEHGAPLFEDDWVAVFRLIAAR